jgi:hypothetical protein
MKPHGEVESMWDAALHVFGSPRAAEEERDHLNATTKDQYFVKRFSETIDDSVYYHFGVYKEN